MNEIRLDLAARSTSWPLENQSVPRKFVVRSWLPHPDVTNALISLDDELIGDTVIGAAKALTIGGDIEPTAIYSVGFGVDDFAQLHLERGKRYTNELTGKLGVVGITDTGAGPEMLDWMESSLIPSIKQTTPKLSGLPALLGFSLSGLFALQCPILRPGLCDKVAAISPSLLLDETIAQGLRQHLLTGTVQSL